MSVYIYLSPCIGLARILEWVAFPFSRGSSQRRSPTLQADSLPPEPQGKPKNTGVGSLSLLQRVFLTQESDWGLLRCRQILYQLSYEESPQYITPSFYLLRPAPSAEFLICRDLFWGCIGGESQCTHLKGKLRMLGFLNKP